MIGAYRAAGWLLTPAAALAASLHPRLRGAWRERLALRLPAVEPGAVVIHGASVGEGQAAAALIAALRRRGCRRVLLRSAFTDTGLATSRGHDALTALPLDLPWAVKRWLDRVRPRALILVESELWPNLLAGCAERGIPVAVVGARAGAGTARLRRLAPALFDAATRAVQLWICKDASGAEALRGWGLGALVVAGEIKGDAPPPPPALRFPRPPLIAGSTRDGEEAAVLDAWSAAPERPPLLLAPRHRERFADAAALLDARGLRWSRRSSLLAPEGGPADVPADVDVVLLDTVGELAGLYAGASAAFVGGTFRPEIGGHSPAEAAAAGLPVVAGPHRSANDWSGVALFEAARVEDLGAAVRAALARGPERGRAGGLEGAGPAALAADALAPLLDAPIPAEAPLRPWLRPLDRAWLALGRRRRARAAPGAAPIPVISVGNLASGGSGKTPAVDWICGALAQAGHQPAVVSRGYRRAAEGPPVRIAGEGADPGDEPRLLASRGWMVVSSPDRLAGVQAAAGRGATVAVLDDGFQHAALRRELDVVVVDARRPLAGGVIPVGESREGPDALARAGVLWVNHGPPPAWPGLPPVIVRAHHAPQGWRDPEAALRPLDALQGEVVAFAGIASPGRFLESLVGLGLQIRAWRTWPDHHPFSQAELEALQREAAGAALVTTEKDRARLPEGFPVWSLQIACAIASGEAALRAALLEAAPPERAMGGVDG